MLRVEEIRRPKLNDLGVIKWMPSWYPLVEGKKAIEDERGRRSRYKKNATFAL